MSMSLLTSNTAMSVSYTHLAGTGGSTDAYSNTMRIYKKIYGRLQANYMRSFKQHNLNVTAVAAVSYTHLLIVRRRWRGSIVRAY